MIRKSSVWLMAFMMLVTLAGCSGAPSLSSLWGSDVPSKKAPKQLAAQPAPAKPSEVPDAYKLGVGDKIKIITFGEANLSGDFEVSSIGTISMPLIGDVQAAGLTVDQLRDAMTRRLKDGYMQDPRVSVEVKNYRPFFIVGEVMKPGSYPYVNDMTVINAVAMAGGYTYRADKDGITVKHGTAAAEHEAGETSVVMPGDVVRVPERFF